MPLSPPLAVALLGLTVVMAAVFVLAAQGRTGPPADRRRGLCGGFAVAAVYLGVSGGLAASGVLEDVDARPPAVGLMLGAFGVATVALGLSRVGDRLLTWPLAALVGFQAFRIAVEVWLAEAYDAGAVPAGVTVHGHNFDIVTGLTAAALGVWLWRGSPPRWVVWAWNVLGLVLLAVVVVTAALSAFGVVETEPRMTLPTTWPGVWLPAWLVQLALLGHVLVFRALRRPARRWEG
ncbi:hypothetical protein [Rubrivirga sp.]|uniref:hypothetical protein n=1 Tax=Rubrivirga sp. TaxID=1885344 RepID=UPI003B52D6B6